jgi:hypothetical protein
LKKKEQAAMGTPLRIPGVQRQRVDYSRLPTNPSERKSKTPIKGIKSAQLHGRDREKPLAKELGGRVQLASGALPQARNKGDVKTDLLLVDSKCTDAASYKLCLKDLEKITREALAMNRIPVLAVQFERDKTTDVMVMRKQDFIAMVKVYEAHTSG